VTTWRCFHCGYETDDPIAARGHFGDSGLPSDCLEPVKNFGIRFLGMNNAIRALFDHWKQFGADDRLGDLIERADKARRL
jgi:hypothetical protein